MVTVSSAEHREAVRAVSEPLAQQVGLVVDDVTIGRAGRRTLVTVVVDLPENEVGSADLDRVADVSRTVGAALDESGFDGDQGYVLEVTTPGVDRPLTQRRHWARARTRLVTATMQDGSTLTGRLTDVTDVGLVLVVSEQPQELPWADVKSGRVELEFNRPST